MRHESLFNCTQLIICFFQLLHHVLYPLHLFIRLQRLILFKWKYMYLNGI